MKRRQQAALQMADPMDGRQEHRRPDYKKKGVLVLASGLLLVGIGVGADQGSRLIAESLQAMASNTPEKVAEGPLSNMERTPMVSEPYRPERLKDFKVPEPVPETREETKSDPETQSTAAKADEPETEPEPQGMTSCSGGVLERDICADSTLRSYDRRIAAAISGPSDPRYQEYLRERERWCAPQPSRANRQECLRDVTSEFLSKL